MHVGLTVLVVTLFIAFEEKFNKMNFDLTRAEWGLLIVLWLILIHASKGWFGEQWKEYKRKEMRRKLLSLNWFDELLRGITGKSN